jgi:hypothetical protein
MPCLCRVGCLWSYDKLSASLSVLMSVFSFQFATLNARVVGYYVAVSTEAVDIVMRSEGFVAGI